MNHKEPAASAGRRARSVALTLAVACTALIGFFGYASLAASPSSATPPSSLLSHASLPPASHPNAGHTGVLDESTPTVANLNPALLEALRRAATDAARDGVRFQVTSGWRSRAHQERLFREAIAKYGSRPAASRWVAVPGTSPHESGNAVDIGLSDAAAWLSRHGAAYGLCQIYRNEPWHYELRPDAVKLGCAPMYADPTQDPRTHR